MTESKKIQTGVWLPEGLYEKAKIQAIRDKVRVSSFIEKALREYFDNHPDEIQK
jgi:hypothetical protein